MSDDIVVYGKTKEEHDIAFRNVLKILRDKNLSLNKNCAFSKTSITSLGHKLTFKGLLPQACQIEAVQKTQKSVKEVKSFLGIANLCSKFNCTTA